MYETYIKNKIVCHLTFILWPHYLEKYILLLLLYRWVFAEVIAKINWVSVFGTPCEIKKNKCKILSRMATKSNKLWCGAQQTPPPSECNWLVNASTLLPPSECNWLWAMAGDNKLTFDPPTRLSELTQNLIRSSHGHSTSSLKISCKSVQQFSRNVADKETKKQRNRAKTIRGKYQKLRSEQNSHNSYATDCI